MTECLICGVDTVNTLLDFGRQPVSSHYANSPSGRPKRYGMALAVCGTCGVIQLAPPFAHETLVPLYDWITYREPEDHLDEIVDRIGALTGAGGIGVAAGVSYKDITTIERLARHGATASWIIDPWRDLGATNANANIETVHGRLTPDIANTIAEERGPADVLVARHIAEHAGAPTLFLLSLEALLKPGGLLVVEVPDCQRNVTLQDYTMIWEEHSLYPTTDTLPALLAGTSFALLDVEVHSYPFEDVLVLYARKNGTCSVGGIPFTTNIAERSLTDFAAYAEAFDHWTELTRATLDWLCKRGALALYGAGHLTCAFVNLHDVADRFAFVVDDTPQKQGLYLPGCTLPIVPRARLADSDVATCLFGLAPEMEDKVIAANMSFVERGGEFHSIFAASSRSIRRLMDLS